MIEKLIEKWRNEFDAYQQKVNNAINNNNFNEALMYDNTKHQILRFIQDLKGVKNA